MLSILTNRTYRHLFAAQALALLGTGVMTVALGLLAFDLAGAQAGMVLGTALAIKMAVYVLLSPVAQALADRLPRRRVLIGLDLVRAAVALALPFVSEVWQVYVLILVLQSASAGFTPLFQATIPDILPDERDYTRALSLSRLAYDLEALASPVLAAAMLGVMGASGLFSVTVVGFLASAALVARVTLPMPAPGPRRGFRDRTTRGIALYLATPRLRGLLALNLAVAAAGAMVIVNTVVIVQSDLGLEGSRVALGLAVYGAGSMAGALALPRLLERRGERAVMLGAALGLAAGLALVTQTRAPLGLAGLWAGLGLASAAVQTPAGRLLRRSAPAEGRPALFAAQFALSHACWLVTYPLAGWLGSTAGTPVAAGVLAGLALAGAGTAAAVWPAADARPVAHPHPDLPPDHPHLIAHGIGPAHRHPPAEDDLHRRPAA